VKHHNTKQQSDGEPLYIGRHHKINPEGGKKMKKAPAKKKKAAKKKK